MQKHYALFTAAALAVAGLTVQASAQNNNTNDADREPVSQQPAGALLERAAETDTSAAELRDDQTQAHGEMHVSGDKKAKMHGEAKLSQRDAVQARSVVIDTVNAVIASPNDLDDLADHFGKDDKQRIGQIESDELEPLVTQLRNDFREKYDQDLRFNEDEVALFQSDFIQYNGHDLGQAQARMNADGDARVAAGTTDTELNPSETSTINQINPQRREPAAQQDTEVTHRTGDAPGAGQQTRAQAHVDTDTDDDRALTAGAEVQSDRGEVRQAHEKMEKGLTIRERNTLSAVHLPLVKEDNELKIDLNDDVRGEQLADNLTTHLRQVGDNKDQWPDDADQAKQQIVHHVLLALSGDQPQTGARD